MKIDGSTDLQSSETPVGLKSRPKGAFAPRPTSLPTRSALTLALLASWGAAEIRGVTPTPGFSLSTPARVATPQEGEQATPKIYRPKRDDDVWTSYRTLTWDDFRGRLERGGMEQALLASAISMEDVRAAIAEGPDGEFIATVASIEVVAVVHKLESRYRTGGRTDYLLRHEQGHFDISELGARKFRQLIPGLSGRGASGLAAEQSLEVKLREAYIQASREAESMQQAYDRETRHGQKKGKQKGWWRKLDALLSESSDH